MSNYRVLRNIRTFSAINVLLSIIVCLSLLILIRDILSPGFSPSTGSEGLRSKTGIMAGPFSHTYKSLKDLEPIIKNNPFGFPGGELRSINPSEGSQSLDMRLIGTVSGGPDYAIFVNKDGRQEVFRRGERIYQSGRLDRVFKDKVVILEGGRSREIPLSDILTIETAKAKESGMPSLVRSAGNNTFIVSQEGILHVIDNPSQLMTDARLQPNYVNGRQEGFLLREVRNGGIYQSLGLQNGDVLLRINNYEITNPEVALQAFTALKGMDRVELDIVRNGTRMTLTYQIR